MAQRYILKKSFTTSLIANIEKKKKQMEFRENLFQQHRNDSKQRLIGGRYFPMCSYQSTSPRMWRSYIYPSRVNSKKYLLVTHYVQNETRTKPELSVGISNKTMQNRLGRRMVRRLSGLFERKQAAECKLGGSGSGLRPGRTGWQCTSSDLETSEMTPICGLNNSERWQTVPSAEMCAGESSGQG